MKGYKVILPAKLDDGHPIMGRGIRIFTPDGLELSAIMGMNLQANAGEVATITLDLPVSVIEHEDPEE